MKSCHPSTPLHNHPSRVPRSSPLGVDIVTYIITEDTAISTCADAVNPFLPPFPLFDFGFLLLFTL